MISLGNGATSPVMENISLQILFTADIISRTPKGVLENSCVRIAHFCSFSGITHRLLLWRCCRETDYPEGQSRTFCFQHSKFW